MTKEEEKGNKEELQQQQQLTSVRRVRFMIDHDKKKKKRGQSIEEKSFYDLQKTIKQPHIVAYFPGGKGGTWEHDISAPTIVGKRCPACF